MAGGPPLASAAAPGAAAAPGKNSTRAEPFRLRPLRLLLATLLPSCTLLPPPMSLPSRLRLLPRRLRPPSGATSAVAAAAAAAAAAAGFP